MRMTGSDGGEFGLEIVGYEFPEQVGDTESNNILLIRVDASTSGGSWSASDPCLQTWDIARLADWLEDLAGKRRTVWSEQSFTEPNLSFHVLHNAGDRAIVRVYFELELRPPWSPSRWAGLRDVWVDLDVAPADLRAGADALREDLSRFPQRGETPDYLQAWLQGQQARRRRLSRLTWQRLRIPPRSAIQ